MAEPSDDLTPQLDAADRLERVIDAQSATLDRIDDKSGRIARLLTMNDSAEIGSEEVTEEDVIIQTPNGERYPAAEINLTGSVSSDE